MDTWDIIWEFLPLRDIGALAQTCHALREALAVPLRHWSRAHVPTPLCARDAAILTLHAKGSALHPAEVRSFAYLLERAQSVGTLHVWGALQRARHGVQLLKAVPKGTLRSLTLDGVLTLESVHAVLGAMPRVNSLRIMQGTLDDGNGAFARAVPLLGALHGLRELQMSDVLLPRDALGLLREALPATCVGLTLARCNVCADSTLSLRTGWRVRALCLNGNALTEAGVERLLRALVAPALERLHLCDTFQMEELNVGVVSDFLGRASALWDLDLSCNAVTADFVGECTGLRRLRRLRRLDLSHNELGDEGVAHVAKMHHPLLTDLDLSDNGVERLLLPRSMVHDMGVFARVRCLRLAYNCVSSQCLRRLAASPMARALRTLGLQENMLEDDAAPALGDLVLAAPGLHMLDLSNNEMGAATLERLCGVLEHGPARRTALCIVLEHNWLAGGTRAVGKHTILS